MGKPQLVQIVNRGVFPRWRLESVGSSSKRDKMALTTQGGWFGSGTKIAPIAAMALGMEVWVSSHDEQGSYLVTYGVEDGPGGKEDPRVVRLYHGETVRKEVTEFSPASFMNWSKPIGSDPMNEFRVWREYFRNGRDADPEGPILSFVDAPMASGEDMTAVFITHTPQYDAIMANVNRYFKYLSNDQPLFEFPGIGQVWPKSEEKVTRMFSLGTMALCEKSSSWSTLFDYSFDQKELMSEERTFDNLAKVYGQLSQMLADCPSLVLAYRLLRAMVNGEAELERNALALLTKPEQIPGKRYWIAAWKKLYGDDAVIEMGNWSDHHARMSFKRKPVHVASHTLRVFLSHCGVQRSVDVIPSGDRLAYAICLQLTHEERCVLRDARAILTSRYPELNTLPVHVFEPRSPEMEMAMLGFCLPETPPFTEVYIRRSELRSLEAALETLNHEFRHVRSGACDGTPEFVDLADKDEKAMLVELRRSEERSWELRWEEFDKIASDSDEDA